MMVISASTPFIIFIVLRLHFIYDESISQL